MWLNSAPIPFSQVIEHVDDPKSFVQACAQCVEGRDGAAGNLFISTMNRTRKAQLMAVVGAEYVLGLLPPGKQVSQTRFIFK